MSDGTKRFRITLNVCALERNLLDPRRSTPTLLNKFYCSLTIAFAMSLAAQSVHAAALFESEFSKNGLNGWHVVNEGPSDDRSDWNVSDGVLRQRLSYAAKETLPQSIAKRGTYAQYLGGLGWRDYHVSMKLRATDGDAFGLMFRLQNVKNYYRFSWDRNTKYRRLVRRHQGAFALLAQDTAVFAKGTSYRLDVRVVQNRIQVSIDGALVFDVVDNALASGTIAAYTWNNDGAMFDDIVVNALDELTDINAPAEEVSPEESPTDSPSSPLTSVDELLRDDFADSDLSNWRVVDEGNRQAPSQWKVNAGAVVQYSNIAGGSTSAADISKRGTYLAHRDGSAWRDYAMHVDMISSDDDTIGVMVRVKDNNNYYRFSWDRQRGYRRLMKRLQGKFYILAEDREPYITDRRYAVVVSADEDKLSVTIDGAPVFAVTDASHAAGTVALYSWANAPSTFDNVRVSAVQGTSEPPPEVEPPSPPVPPVVPPPTPIDGLTTISDEAWDETAVRQVLHVFAFGGQARDEQIRVWADMPAQQAIAEMLTFSEHNTKLSKPAPTDKDNLASRTGTLRALSDLWSSGDAANRVPGNRRNAYRVGAWSAIEETWKLASLVRGLNPFRQRFGFLETNYHMAVSRYADVTGYQFFKYFDDIMQALNSNAPVPYQDVMTLAASSAAIARHYGHKDNRFYGGECHCNEDFAREYHQLFHGILGEDDPEYHELVTVKNTAAALTDITLENRDAPAAWQGAYVRFGSKYHTPGDLEILNHSIPGNDALQRLEALAEIAITHPESEANLPVILIRWLADDELDQAERAALSEAWRAMADKDVLTFLRNYAVSSLFHSSNRVKRFNTFERHMIRMNLFGLSNDEHYQTVGTDGALMRTEGVEPFAPVHGVFGGQTGIEAARSADIFRLNWNQNTADVQRLLRTGGNVDGRQWEKRWSDVVPKSSNGQYVVRDVAKWLWQRFVADGLANYGVFEQAYLHSLLARGQDLSATLHPGDPAAFAARLASDLSVDPALTALVNNLGSETLDIDSAEAAARARETQRIGQAVAFISATPYIFAQRGRNP